MSTLKRNRVKLAKALRKEDSGLKFVSSLKLAKMISQKKSFETLGYQWNETNREWSGYSDDEFVVLNEERLQELYALYFELPIKENVQ